MAELTYAFTVLSTRCSRLPISAFESPAPTSASTSRFLGANAAMRYLAAISRLMRPPRTWAMT